MKLLTCEKCQKPFRGEDQHKICRGCKGKMFKKEPRKFTIWRKRDVDLPGPSVKVSEKPHRDVLIGYEEIDVVEEVDDEYN